MPATQTPNLDLSNINVFMTTDEIKKLATSDPQKAQIILDIQDRLAARTKQDKKVQQDADFAIMQLKDVQRRLGEEKAAQDGCESRGHTRDNGEIAVSGQRNGDGQYFLVCARCSKNFKGFGNKPGQLPLHIANRLNTEMLGR